MSQLLEEILSRENMQLAYKRVKANKGAGGVDGITIEEVDKYLKENWEDIQEKNPKEEVQAKTGEESRDTKNRMEECETSGYLQ